MSSDDQQPKASAQDQPIYAWLPPLVLKFLVLGAFVFVLYEALIGLGSQELSSGRTWVIVAGLGGLLLLLGIDRLTGLRVSPQGLEATLAEAKAQALKQVAELEDKEVIEAAQSQIRQAGSREEVEGALGLAMELNVNRVVRRARQAIRQKRKLYVRYQSSPDEDPKTFLVAPLDIKPGATPATQARDYLWVYHYEAGRVMSLLLKRVLSAEISEETFDPAEIVARWDEQDQDWNVPRDW
ncbi:MAG: WYL domain-containing protein [Anaerolineae bacterium]|jgi:predicted DNA-binding transcriptional regulator YafY